LAAPYRKNFRCLKVAMKAKNARRGNSHNLRSGAFNFGVKIKHLVLDSLEQRGSGRIPTNSGSLRAR
jgi:hypothetical protein